MLTTVQPTIPNFPINYNYSSERSKYASKRRNTNKHTTTFICKAIRLYEKDGKVIITMFYCYSEFIYIIMQKKYLVGIIF